MSKILSRFHRVFLHQQRLSCAFLTATIRLARRTCRENVMHHQDCITEKKQPKKQNWSEKLWYVCVPETEEGTLSKMEVLAGDKGLSTLYMWFCFQRLEDSGEEGRVAHLGMCCHHVVNNGLWCMVGTSPPGFPDWLLMGNLKVVPKCRRGYQIPRWVLMCITLLVIVVWWLSERNVVRPAKKKKSRKRTPEIEFRCLCGSPRPGLIYSSGRATKQSGSLVSSRLFVEAKDECWMEVTWAVWLKSRLGRGAAPCNHKSPRPNLTSNIKK